MATRKDRKFQTEPRSKQRKSKLADECTLPSKQERLPLHIPGTYQVATGTGVEIVTWLRGVPGNHRAILISFPNEASYRVYGPVFWQVANKLPGIVERIQRRRFEELVDALTQLFLTQPGTVSAAVPSTRVAPAKGALPRPRRGDAK